MKLTTYRWHSVNVIPHGGWTTTLHDDKTHGRHYWVTVLGVVLDLDIKHAKKVRHFISPVVGPCWSRRTGRLYWLGDDSQLYVDL
jgi:hypothetical protein